jgi:hypothetical protein
VWLKLGRKKFKAKYPQRLADTSKKKVGQKEEKNLFFFKQYHALTVSEGSNEDMNFELKKTYKMASLRQNKITPSRTLNGLSVTQPNRQKSPYLKPPLDFPS